MNKLIALSAVFFCAISASLAGHYGSVGLVGPAAPGTVLHGPGAEASVVGPDGSHIAAHGQAGVVVAPPIHGGSVAAAVSPGYVAHTAGIYAAAPVAVVGVGAYGSYGYGGAGSGHEGQYVHDYTETLYDDGSYRGDHGDGGHYY